MPRVLIVGVSTRAAAESAVRAGHDVVAVDAFGDLDHPSTCLMPPEGRWRASLAARLARDVAAGAVVYLSDLENDPGAVASLTMGRSLWGNSPEILRRARAPLAVRDAFRAAGIPAPDATADAGAVPAGEWLLKPLRSGGGGRVRRWRRGQVPPGHYAQRRVEGQPGSVVFVAAGGRAHVLGTTRQLVGEAAFGATGFRYCGSILDLRPAPESAAQDAAIATAAATAFGLTGVGGVDFIDDGRVRHPIEVNPRWTASMELVERASGASVFAAHAAACTTGALPAPAVPAAGAVHGKAIVFARQDVTLGDTRAWLGDATRRDITRPRVHLRAGQPVCTVLACEPDEAACYRALVGGAVRIHDELARWARNAA